MEGVRKSTILFSNQTARGQTNPNAPSRPAGYLQAKLASTA
jgi:hypothetical protein